MNRQSEEPAGTTELLITRGPVWGWALALLLMPILVLWWQDNSLFTSAGRVDPWLYLGFFRDLVNYKQVLAPDTYYGSRLAWLLPGYAVHSFLPPVAATAVLHLLVLEVCVLSLFFLLRLLLGARPAFLAAMVFSLHPWLWTAAGWDYTDGACVAYWLTAVAATTCAAAKTRHRMLAAAGMALAGAIYCNLFWVVYAWSLPLWYVVQVWHWRRESPSRSAVRFALWAGGGFALVTAMLASVEYAITGHWWFYAPSIATALAMPSKIPWETSIWEDGGLAPWLWFAAVAAAASAYLVGVWLWQRRRSQEIRAFLGAQFLAMLAVTGYLQGRGNTVLGIFYYASGLMAFSFPVLGVTLWPAAGKLSRRGFVLLCGAAVVTFGFIWWDYQGAFTPLFPHAMRLSAAAGGLCLLAALALRHRSLATWFALAGLAILTAEVRYAPDQRYNVPSPHPRSDVVARDPHEHRRLLEQLVGFNERLEQIRRGNPILVWYNLADPEGYFCLALGALYARSPLPHDTSKACTIEPEPGTVLLFLNPDGGFAQEMRAALTKCWKQNGLLPTLVWTERVHRNKDFQLTVLRVDRDTARWRPVRLESARDGGALLAAGSFGPAVPLPLERWHPTGPEADMRWIGPRLQMRTPRPQYAFMARYPRLVSAADARYSFELSYYPGDGRFAFGARAGDDSGWLAVNLSGTAVGREGKVAFWVNLKRNQEFSLLLANNNLSDRPSSFRIRELSAFEVLP